VRFIEESGSAEVDDFDLGATGQPIVVALGVVEDELFLFTEDVLWFEISMSVTDTVQEGHTFEELSCEGLNHFDGEASVIVLLDDVVEGSAERLEDHAEVSSVIKRVFISDESFLVLLVSFVDVFQYLFFNVGGLNIFSDGSDDLREQYSTFIA
jgi:hypothetical protein